MDMMRFYIKMVQRELSFRGQKLRLTDQDLDDLMAQRYGTFRLRKLSSQGAREDMEEDGRIDDLGSVTEAIARAEIAAYENRYDEGVVRNIEQLRKTKGGAKRKDVREYDRVTERVGALRKKFNL